MRTDWKASLLKSVATLQRGYDLPHRLRKSGDIPIVTSSGFESSHCDAKVRAPGVVTGRYGTIGEVFFVEEDFWPLNTTLFVRDFHGNDPLFISYLLRTINFHTHSGKSGVPGVNRNDLHEIEVSIPRTKVEQAAIAKALSDADALIESLEQLLAKKRQIKQGAMQELLSGKKRLPGFNGTWEFKQLGTLGTFTKGSGVRKDQSESGDLPCVRYGEIYTQHENCIKDYFSRISPAVATTATKLKKGDLLFAGSGETKAEIGKCVAFLDDIEAYAGGDIVILRGCDADAMFLGYFLNTAPINAKKASKGQGDAVVHISATALGNLDIRLPDREEQAAIATILFDMDIELTALDARLAKARQLKQGMMQVLLTGRIRLI